MHGVQFAGMTRIRMGLVPGIKDWNNRQETQRWDAANVLFHQAVEKEMDRMQGGNPDHAVTVFPLFGLDVLVVDGPELAQLPDEIQKERQRQEQLGRENFRRVGRHGIIRVSLQEPQQALRELPPAGYGWKDSSRWDFTGLDDRVKNRVLFRYAQAADEAGPGIDMIV